MKKTYKIDVDCANCANKMEEAARKTEGVQSATVNFMALKMIVEFAEGQDPKAVPVGSQSQFQLRIAPIKITAPMITEAIYQCSCKKAVICPLFIYI